MLDLASAYEGCCFSGESINSDPVQERVIMRIKALAGMQQHGTEVISREMLAVEWLESADNPMFCDVLSRFIR
ncbi:MAG: hypothetical protein KGP14_01255 [Betaproteobacteria bacterium]|nr:hypothetical protein [Betaproteobacteria bacterium]